MTDTSNADNSPDAKAADPTPIITAFRRNQGGDNNFPSVWNRGRDQPTTVGGADQWSQPFALGQSKSSPPNFPPDKPRGPPPGPMPGQRVPQPGPPPRGAPIPPNMPQPPARFNAYVPARVNPVTAERAPTMWGVPEPFAATPHAFEVPSILQGVGQFFGSMGSGFTGPMGLGLLAFSSAYAKAYNAGKSELSKQYYDNMKRQHDVLQMQQQEESDAYADVVSAYYANGNQPINGVTFEQALGDIAGRYNDTRMSAILHSQGIGAAVRLIQNRDAHWQDGHAAGKVSAGTSDEQTGAGAWGDPSAAPETGGAGGAPTAGGATGSDGLPAIPGVSGPAAAGSPAVPPHMQGAPPDSTTPHGDTLDSGLSDEEKNAGRDIFRDLTPKDMPKAVGYKASAYAERLNGAVDRLIRDAKARKMTPDEIASRLEQITGSSSIASDYRGLQDYSAGPTGGMGAASQSGYWSRLRSLAEIGTPGWNIKNFDAQERFRTDDHVQDILRRAETAPENAMNVLNDLKLLPNNADLSWETIKTKLGGSDADAWKYRKLWADWKMYSQEVTALATPGGSVTLSQETHEGVPWYADAASYRAVLKGHMDGAAESLGGVKDRWRGMGGQPEKMPGGGDTLDKASRNIDRIKTLDPETGMMAGDTKTDIHGQVWTYTGNNPSNPDDDSNWVKGGSTAVRTGPPG